MKDKNVLGDITKNATKSVTDQLINKTVEAVTDHMRNHPKRIWIGNICITIGTKNK